METDEDVPLRAILPHGSVSVLSTSASQDLLQSPDSDPFNEDEAELRFLHSKPTCFIVVGKPGVGKTTMAKKLAQEWKCELVNATEVILQAVELQTEVGVKCQELLMHGEAIPEDMAAKMIEDKINSDEVAHHGYVLDGFPSLSEDYMSVKDQLDLVNNWKFKPDFIVNLKLPDHDLEVRRLGQRVDPQTGEIYTKDVYDPDKTQKKGDDLGEGEGEEEEEEEAEEEAEEEGEENELEAEILERLIRRPEDLTSHVNDNIHKYKSNLLNILEDYMADHDQQYLIELDANKPANDIFKELMMRLNCFVLRPAAVPLRLQEMDDEELPEDIETDELMRTLAPKQMVAPRFRWRRSRWLRNCPVALAEGNVSPGKPEFAVSFLDKMYVLWSGEAMEKFLKNPRPYLMPPQPRPPCKLSITGPALSGKTTLARLLAQKYNAKVLDINELIKPRLAQEKEKQLDSAKEEALEIAIQTVKNKLREEQEAKKLQLEQMTSSELDEGTETRESEAKVTEGEDESTEKSEKDQKEGEEEKEATPAESEDIAAEAIRSEKAEPVAYEQATVVSEEPVEEIDADHPQVQEMVQAAVETAKEHTVTLSADVYVEVMEAAIKEAEKENRINNPDGSVNGGWIMDNFPCNRDQWNALVEKGLLPDEVICLKDESERHEYLLKRWYQQCHENIDEQIRQRKMEEERIKQERLEEARRRAEAERLAAEEEARKKKEEERQRRLDAGETLSEVDGSAEQEQEQEVEKPTEPILSTDSEMGQVPDISVTPSSSEIPDVGEMEKADGDGETDEHEITEETEKDLMPPDGPELEAQREVRKKFDIEWPNMAAVISGNTSIEPLILDIQDKTEEDLMAQAFKHMEKGYIYQGWENSGMDIDEEEEDMDADIEEEAEEEAEEEEDVNRSNKKPLGDTNYYCPVALKETFMLWPGNPEIAARYREKLYYFSSEEAREKFLDQPAQYLPQNKPLTPPPVRLLILGPRGAGKSLQGRRLAEKLGLFHIQFRERLQEMIIAKTKVKVGPEYEDDKEDPADEEDEEDEEKVEESEQQSQTLEKESSKLSTVSEGAQEKEDETEEPEFTEDEQAIKDYLEEDTALPSEILDKTVASWWHKEPFKSTGFILEGFPRTTDEAAYMAEQGLFPDAAIMLSVEDTDVIGRLLPPKLEKWKQRRDKQLAKKQRVKEKAQKKREAEIAKRREELVKEKEEKRAERKAERAAEQEEEDSDVEEEEEEEEDEEEDNIEDLLAEEFPEEEEEEEDEEETEEDATDRIRNSLEEVYDNDVNRISAVQDQLEMCLIPRLEIEAGRKPHIIKYTLTKKLRTTIQFRHSLFERVYSIGEALALRMLKVGYKQPSRFGRWCPIKLLDGDCVQPMQGPGYQTFPAIYRQFIYFFSSVSAREQFTQNPRMYLRQPTPKPVVPIRIAIIGPPKSGKTALAQRFQSEYGLLRLSIGEALRLTLASQPRSELSQAIQEHLKKGLTVPDELAVQALEVALMDMRAQTRGYVLDGYPVNKQQVDLMTQRSIIPVRVVELTVDSKEVMSRAWKDRYSPDRTLPLHDSVRILAIKLASYQKNVVAVRDWYTSQHQNWQPVEGKRSKWYVWNSLLDVAKKSVIQIQTYLQKVADGKAASIADMCITPKEFTERLGDYGQYCPVSLALRGELVDNSTNPTLDYAAEFRGYYYKMAGKTELGQFLGEPEKYVPPLAPRKLPDLSLLPKRRSQQEVKQMFPKPIELQGYCPVTFLDGKCRYESIIPGNPEFVVEYLEKLYSLESEEKLLKFMRLPENYYNLKLPHKLPPKKDPMQVTGLPMLGFMEQTAAQAIIKALTAVGNFKPKYPFLTPTHSALVYFAYHLKAYNPKSSDYVRKKYRKKLNQFEETCELIKYLGDTMTRRYREPKDRPIDFDFKLQTFVELKGKLPTTTWIA